MAENKNYLPPLNLRDVAIIWKNLSGERGEYNANGSRYFSLVLDRELGEELAAQGLPVKFPENEEYNPTLQVTLAKDHDVIFDNVNMFIVDGNMVRRIPNNDFNQINRLDKMPISRVDISLTQSVWEVGGRSGIKPYIRTVYFKLRQDNDPFAADYQNFNVDTELPFEM